MKKRGVNRVVTHSGSFWRVGALLTVILIFFSVFSSAAAPPKSTGSRKIIILGASVEEDFKTPDMTQKILPGESPAVRTQEGARLKSLSLGLIRAQVVEKRAAIRANQKNHRLSRLEVGSEGAPSEEAAAAEIGIDRALLRKLDRVKTYRSLRGIEAVASEHTIEELRKRSDLRVFEDVTYELDPDPLFEGSSQDVFQPQSMETQLDLLGVSTAASAYNLTGEGVVVAVLDTGIDYRHQDFGNCSAIGDDCRVLSGYDFYNKDSDPLDGDGHGTHVAGIIGASGEHRGVAPNVTFMAVKVCSDSGMCSSSAMIRGLDYAFSEGADVIHLSIGAAAYPNSPFADATSIVASAISDLGVPVVISAGNIGPGVNSIASPGAARGIVTVGAVNDQGTPDISDDTVPAFSSRGPSAFGRLDPDVLAPGVAICSSRAQAESGTTCGDEDHVLKTGTSMSAPFVTGMIALLQQQQYTEYGYTSKYDLLRRLYGSASTISGSLFDQGFGVPNVTRALEQRLFVTYQGSSSLEIDVEPGFNYTFALDLTNSGETEKVVLLAVGVIQDLKGLTVYPSEFMSIQSSATVPAGSTETVLLNISTSSTLVPGIYSGYIIVEDELDIQQRTPFILRVPAVGEGSVPLAADYSCSGCWGGISSMGDWLYFPFISRNGSALSLSLSWGSVLDDLDLYVFSPASDQVGASGAADTTSETITLSDLTFDRYWVAVHSYFVRSRTSANLTFSYVSNFSITPERVSMVVSDESSKDFSFSITNDMIQRNVSLSIVKPSVADTCETEIDLFDTSGSVQNIWNFSSCPLLATADVVNLTLEWDDPSIDADIYFRQWDGSSWTATSAFSVHNNSLLNMSWEQIAYLDVGHARTKDEMGIGAVVRGSGTATLSVSPVRINLLHESASVSPALLSLEPGELDNAVVTINTSLLDMGRHEFFLNIESTGLTYGPVPVVVDILQNRSPLLTAYIPESLVISLDENASIVFNHTAYDPDGDSVVSLWFLNSTLTSTEVSWRYSPGFSDAGDKQVLLVVSDGYHNTTKTWNVTVENVNRDPVLIGNLTNVTVYEGELVSLGTMNLSWIDPDNESVSIGYSSPLNASGEWETGIDSGGIYVMTLNLSDGVSHISYSFTVTVLDSPDLDGDGVTDYMDLDDDGDGIPDVDDVVRGNSTAINTSTLVPVVRIENSTNLSQSFTGVMQVVIDSNGSEVLQFYHNFSSSILDFSAMRLESESGGPGSILIAGLNQTGTKNATIRRTSTSMDYVCIRDHEPGDVLDISAGCSRSDEILVPCTGSTVSGYICSVVSQGSAFRISGLMHSEVRHQCGDEDGDGYWIDGCGSGNDCDDSSAAVNPGEDEFCGDEIDNNCDGDIDEGCTAVAQTGGGGGGGGSSRTAQRSANNSTTNSSVIADEGSMAVSQSEGGSGEGDSDGETSDVYEESLVENRIEATDHVTSDDDQQTASIPHDITGEAWRTYPPDSSLFDSVSSLWFVLGIFLVVLFIGIGKWGGPLTESWRLHTRIKSNLGKKGHQVKIKHVKEAKKYFREGEVSGLKSDHMKKQLTKNGWDPDLVDELYDQLTKLNLSRADRKMRQKGQRK